MFAYVEPIAGKYDFTISYIANNAYWIPYYDVRVDDIKSPIKLITKAKISQTTGIDWKQVKLSLSTSMPSQWGNAPILNAWYLAYINPVYRMDKKLMTMNSIQPIMKNCLGVFNIFSKLYKPISIQITIVCNNGFSKIIRFCELAINKFEGQFTMKN